MFSILDLPNELLSIIFTNLTPPVSKDPEYHSCTCRRNDLFAIRSTCQKFRAITNELQIWYNEDFKVIEMIPPRREWNSEDDCHDYDAGFLKVLFQDKHLVKSLARRKSWHFKSLETLMAVDEHIPTFRRKTTAVQLLFSAWSSSTIDDWEPSSLEATIRHLNVCRRLRSLSIFCTPDDEDLDLNWIAISCPSLYFLRLTGIDMTENSLKRLSNLKSFVADDLSPAIYETILPINCTKTLTHLAILYSHSDFECDNACINGTFDRFVNLTSLFVHPLSDPMCDVLHRSKFILNDFRTTLRENGTLDIDKVVRLFSSASLRHLQVLRIAFTGPDEWPVYYPRILESITTRLRNLEELVLSMGLNTTWSEMLTRLSSLKRLVWYVPEDNWRDPLGLKSCPPGAANLWETLLLSQKDKADIAKERFIAAFKGFVEKPHVEFQIYGDHMEGGICECNLCPILFEDQCYFPLGLPMNEH